MTNIAQRMWLPKLRQVAYTAVSSAGLKISRTVPQDLDEQTRATYGEVSPYTMTSAERVNGLVNAVRYVSRYDIPGAIVECGVWRGGSMMAIARTLATENATDRDLYLYDTFEGMTPPTTKDVDFHGKAASAVMEEAARKSDEVLAYASQEDVERNLRSTGYPAENIKFIKGRVEDTLPDSAPEKIALLRLDTDWYESTAHELRSLVHRISPGGVLIIDDYGHWEGARKAVDEFLLDYPKPILLNRMDYSGRIAVVM